MLKEQAVWDKAKPLKGRDPDKVRQDPYGNEIHRSQCGQNTPHGWTIDHITPKSRGGSNHIANLQAMYIAINHKMSDSSVKKSRYDQL